MTESVYDNHEWFAFVEAIRRAPDDDTPRLVVADWLDERGEGERAELIRVQCEIARAKVGCTCGACRPNGQHTNGPCAAASVYWNGRRATHRERELLGGPNPRPVDEDVSVVMVRGFAESISLPASAWLKTGDHLIRRDPFRSVELTTWPEGSVTLIRGQRSWKIPPVLGGHVLDCWRAEWPGIEFKLPPHTVAPPSGGWNWADAPDMPDDVVDAIQHFDPS
ncbi:Repeat-companion domain protein OS=Isosphaera pallida (strain ATCC 43644 / DSM 9630 / IS1B) GN=Isop_0537 PE=4 SV=1 [Gemmataceae bacterium]|nr:Repeat-companion domain protein OS=Isosphaera pallida (strain ATCC 43644 / DSM 9630 / IS1B) GN=Isop_0537 PE=4 SV=1 [Gemmataceae bacterium]VTT98929.1 Repeat-companion domain protein OS=Isosphaera pallida (strain ATCC 43644 / DSM 9630 / IS1B) GN=Isop_0537 PE=4 SV=1 [Gemmataceae bacterium]